MEQYTVEECLEKAKKYDSWSKFTNTNRKMRTFLIDNKLKEYICNACGWVKKPTHPIIKWTYEACRKAAEDCISKADYHRKHGGAWLAASKNGWLDDFFGKSPHWDYDSCLIESKKYTNLKDFYTESNGAYDVARKMGWLNEYTWLSRVRENAWTYERCYDEAKKYTKLKDFCLNSRLAHKAARKKGWLKDYVWLEKSGFNLFGNIDCNYAYEFEEYKYVYVGRTIDKKSRDRAHVFVGTDPVHKFAKEHNIPVPKPKILADNLTIQQACEGECYWMKWYEDNGWTLLNTAPGGAVGNLGKTKYSHNKCRELASLCVNRNDMRKKFSQAYDISLKKGWLDEFFGENNRKKPIKYTNNSFKLKANEVHNNKYDYSKVNYKGTEANICIICQEHGEFWQNPITHISGSGCPKCARENQKYTNNEFKEKANEVHNNKYDYSKVNYIDSETKVCIICPEHGEFWQKPKVHLKGCGCHKCGKEKVIKLLSDTKEEFIEKARKIHEDKYDYSKVEYVNNHTKVCIICPEHGEFWQKPDVHLKGCGCPKCGAIKRSENKNYNTEIFIEKARNVHGNKYDYSKVNYIDSETKVCIICPEHGEFWQRPAMHISGNGCPKCARPNINLTISEFKEKANEVHNNKYDYSKVNYINLKTKVCIICPEHGEFWQTPDNHLKGQGCPKCGAIKRANKNLITNEDYIKRAKQVHGDKFDYSKTVYKGMNEKICIIIPGYGEVWQKAGNHLYWEPKIN